jgi:hypothetical protein
MKVTSRSRRAAAGRDEVKQDGCGLGDRADAGRAQADPLQGREGLLKQCVRAFSHAVHAADELVVRALRLGQLPAHGPLERMADRRGQVEVAQVGECRDPVLALARGEGDEQPGRGFRTGGVVLAPRANPRDPDRITSRIREDLCDCLRPTAVRGWRRGTTAASVPHDGTGRAPSYRGGCRLVRNARR